MKHLKALVLMQLRDKIDLSYLKDRKSSILKFGLALLKFVLTTVICYAVILVAQRFFNLFTIYETAKVMVFVLSVFFLLSLISCTVGLMKAMYFSDDNKVLVTFPVSPDLVFISKLLVFYIYELKRNLSLLLPIMLAFGAFLINFTGALFFLRAFIFLFFYTAAPVLVGALLSIPALFVYRFGKRFPWVVIILFALALAAVVFALVQVIAVIPVNIELSVLWPNIIGFISSFLTSFESKVFLLSQFVYTLIGEPTGSGNYAYTWISFAKTAIIFATEFLVCALVFIITRFVFYAMMRKSFEFSKNKLEKPRKNRRFNYAITFFMKELRLNFRTFGQLLSFIAVYIAVPIMIFLMNKIFAALNRALTGDCMSYAFNVLIIVLPILASNSVIATLLSKEGRAGYIKKSKPINPIIPLIAKIFPYLVLSTVSIVVSVLVFAYFNTFAVWQVVALTLGLLLLQYGHVFWCITLDFMNPQNEQYATTGEDFSNPNETTATVIAFLLSGGYALFSYKLFSESLTFDPTYNTAFIKLCLIGTLVFVSCVSMFILKTKAFYGEK